MHIHITKEQMEKLKKSTDPIYMDGLISEVLAQTDFGTIQLVKEYTVDVTSTIWDGMPSLPSLPSLPDMSDINFNALPRSRPILINFTLLVLTFFVCRRFGINYLIVIFFALVYCLYEYLDNECHRVCVFFSICEICDVLLFNRISVITFIGSAFFFLFIAANRIERDG